MPLQPAAVRKQIAGRRTDPVYLIVGDDDAEAARLAGDLLGLVDDELRAFNTDRLHASDKGFSPAAIVEAARLLPMMGDRRVVVVLRAEKLLKPKRGGKMAEQPPSGDAGGDAEPATALDQLEAYVKSPVPSTTLVLVASDVDRTRRIYKALQKHATIVECWGLKGGRDAKPDLRAAARTAEQLVKEAVAAAGQEIDAGAVRLLAARAGTDIATLRGDVERLLLYAAGAPRISLDDARQVVTAESSQDDWAVTEAIRRQDAAEALRQLALAIEAGGVPYVILGQLAWFVRARLPEARPRRVEAAVEALLETDLALKSSVGDPRALLERLVVDLCRG